MHELSLVEGIRSIVEDQARVHGFSRVTRLRLEIGAFAGVEKAALTFAWDVAMKGSIAEGAELEMLDLPGLHEDCGDRRPAGALPAVRRRQAHSAGRR